MLAGDRERVQNSYFYRRFVVPFIDDAGRARRGDRLTDAAGAVHRVVAALPSKLLVEDQAGDRWVIGRQRVGRGWALLPKRGRRAAQ